MQNPVVGEMQGHKSYHLDDPFPCYPNVGKVKHDVSNAPRDLQVSLVSIHLTPLHFILWE